MDPSRLSLLPPSGASAGEIHEVTGADTEVMMQRIFSNRDHARYDDLVDGNEEPIDVSGVDISMNGIELQDREFVAAITEGREPNASVASVLPCYEVLDRIERQLAAS